jgi:UDP-N-acetylglucosamine--N-acetylmuramyl-(pentapeptide) pyrophosphoryl-undecaprenol N-acetylglucosamine transferase
MGDSIHIMFAGGGTGGHLFPGLAVAEHLVRGGGDVRVTFCGTGKPWERSLVAQYGYDYRDVAASPFIASPAGLVRSLVSNGVGYRAARQWLRSKRRSRRHHFVVGLGGYASVPLGLAAARSGVPLVLMEQNLVPGRANKLLSRWSSIVCTTFEESARYFSSRPRVLQTGNPVRRVIIERAAERATEAIQVRDSAPLLLVLGGSQGAHRVNEFVSAILPGIADYLRDWRVIHQTGAQDVESVRATYEANRIPCEVTPFIEDIAAAYSNASLAISRAGGTTLSELAVSGVPAILVPYAFATANHQWHNAQQFARAGGAIVVEDRPESGRSAAALQSAIVPLLRIPELRREMRLGMLKLARPDAAEAVAAAILSTLRSAQPTRRSA